MEVRAYEKALPYITTLVKKKSTKRVKNLTPILQVKDSSQALRKCSTNTKNFYRKRSVSKFKVSSSLNNKLVMKPNVSADCWVLMKLGKNRMIEGKNENTQREIASLTKIMTCITVILEVYHKGRSFDELVTVSERAASTEGTSACLQPSEKIRVLDLLYGLMLPSGNDAAISLAEHIGSIISPEGDPLSNFLCSMNKNAKNLKLDKTLFNNPHGMSTSLNLSTAYEVGVMACYAMKNSLFQAIVSTKKYSCSGYIEGKIKRNEWINTNCLLDKGFVGVKTGTTPAAGACLCFCIKKKKKRILGVLLASKTPDIRWNEALRLVNYTNKCN